MLRKIGFLILILSFDVKADQNCGSFLDRDCSQPDIYKLLDSLYVLNYEGEQKKLIDETARAIKACQDTVDVYLDKYCEATILKENFFNSTSYKEDILSANKIYKFLGTIKADGIKTPDVLDLFSYLVDYIGVIEVNDRDYKYDDILDLLKAYKPQHDSSNNRHDNHFLARWYLEYARMLANYSDDEEEIIKAFTNAIKEFENYETKARSLNNNDAEEFSVAAKVELLEYYSLYFEIDKNYFDAATRIALEIVNLDGDDAMLFTDKLLALSILADLEVNHDASNYQKNVFLIMFMEYFTEIVLINNYYSVPSDQAFISPFPSYLLELDCDERMVAWRQYNQVREIRSNKLELATEEELDKLEPRSIRIENRNRLLECGHYFENINEVNTLLEELAKELEFSFELNADEIATYELLTYVSAIETLSIYLDDADIAKFKTEHLRLLSNDINFYKNNKELLQEFRSFYLISSLLFQLSQHDADKDMLFDNLFFILDVFTENVLESEFSTTGTGMVIMEITLGLLSMGFGEKAEKLFSNYFLNKQIGYLDANENIFKGDIFDGYSRLAISSFVLNKNINNEKYKKELFNALNFIDRGPLELSVIFSQLNTDQEIISSMETFTKTDRLKNAFMNERLTQADLKIDKSKIINQILDYKISFDGLSSEQISSIQEILYPDLSLENIRAQLSDQEVLVMNYGYFYQEDHYLTNISISKDEFSINFYDTNDLFFSVIDIFDSIEIDLQNSLISNIPYDVDYIKKVSKMFLPKFDFRDMKLIFVSNNQHAFNPNVLYHNDRWLIESNFYQTFFTISDFMNNERSSTYVPSNYVGIGAIDYTNHPYRYPALNNTFEELTNIGKKFQDSKILTGNSATIDMINSLSLENSILHFATHTSSETDPYSPIPSLLISNSKNYYGYIDLYQISNLNLSNSHIILAACDTDSEIFSDQDSLSGFIKSLKNAGSKSVIATRWDIETSSAEKIVDLYIDSLLDGLSSNDSLIYSQRELIKQDMHPYFWSAYFSFN